MSGRAAERGHSAVARYAVEIAFRRGRGTGRDCAAPAEEEDRQAGNYWAKPMSTKARIDLCPIKDEEISKGCARHLLL